MFWTFDNNTTISLRQYSLLQIIKQRKAIDTERLLCCAMICQSESDEHGFDYNYKKDLNATIKCQEMADDINFLIKNRFITTKKSTRQRGYEDVQVIYLLLKLSEEDSASVVFNKNIEKVLEDFKTFSTENLGYHVYLKSEGDYKALGQKIELTKGMFDEK